MTTPSGSPGYVLVGVGYSPAASAATRWGAAEAVRRGVALQVVRVLSVTHDREDLDEARRRVPAHVGDWLAETEAVPAVAVRVTVGDVARTLRHFALRAEVVVLGSSEASASHQLVDVVTRGCTCEVVVVDPKGRAHQVSASTVTGPSTPAPIVRDVMTSPAFCVDAHDPVDTAVRQLMLHDVTSLPVVDGEGHLVGVVGEPEVVRQMAQNRPQGGWRVLDVMSPLMMSVSPDDPLLEVAELFGRTPLTSVPVVHHDRLVGVVSQGDLVRAAARHQLPAVLGTSV